MALAFVGRPVALATAFRCILLPDGSTFESEPMEVEVVTELEPFDPFFSRNLHRTELMEDTFTNGHIL